MFNSLPLFVNALITFGLAMAPLFIASVVFLEPERRTSVRIIKRFFFLGTAGNALFLFLFTLFRAILRDGGLSFADTLFLMCRGINVKFLSAVFILNLFVIGTIKFGKVDIRYSKLYISKPALVLFSASLFLITGSFTFKKLYMGVPLEQILFHIKMPKSGANFSMVYEVIQKTFVDSTLLFILAWSFLSFGITFKERRKILYINIPKKYQRAGAGFFAAAALIFFLVNMGLPEYITSLEQNRESSAFYESSYIDPNAVDVVFPEQKRNLIVIFVESLETGFLTKENGGAFTETLLPGIENLVKDNINFSAAEGPGGAHQMYGTGWTIAGIIAQYSGLPLNLPFEGNNYGRFLKTFLPGASGINDILYKAGYKSYFILGSQIEFAGRDKYFASHKDTVIYDYHYFLENGYIPKNYNVWWGFEDRKLYDFAKEKIAEAAREEPFFFTLLTVDTHPEGGYLDPKALKPFDVQYKNVLFDADALLSDFLNWLFKQPFYENTTVVVLGDHLYMDASFFPEDFKKSQGKRFPLNIFINSLLREDHVKNRIFSPFDIFPALVDSIGGRYDTPGLALGRSMNKGEATLLEQFNLDYVDDELQKRSEYYNDLWSLRSEK